MCAALAAARSPSDKGMSLREVASAGSALLRKCGGRNEAFVAAGGAGLFSPHVDVEYVREFFSNKKRFPQIDQLFRVLCPLVHQLMLWRMGPWTRS